MKNILILFSIMLLFNAGCLTKQAFEEFVAEESAVDSNLINYALAENGGRVLVSNEIPPHLASNLTNGITSSDKWDQGEGWEANYEGPFVRGSYFEYGQDAWLSGAFGGGFGGGRGDPNQQRPRPGPTPMETDPLWRGLRRSSFYGEVSSALAVAIIDFPEEKQVGRVVVYTIDSEKYPPDEYGVSDLLLQYWATSARSWFNIERYGKAIEQKHDSIQNNRAGNIVFRFKPVKTSKIRLAVRWTNDTERYKVGQLQYAKGTVRLTEVEVYGFEKKTSEKVQLAKSGSMSQPDQLQLNTSTQTQTANAKSEVIEEPDPLQQTLKEVESKESENPGVDERSAILQVIRAYEKGYKNRDLGIFISTISPNYLRDGENFQQLRQRMEKLFAKYDQVDFALNEIQVEPSGRIATATATYFAKLHEKKNLPLELSGKLFFKLSKENDGWQIYRVDTQKK